MPKTWSEVEQSQEYNKLSVPERLRAKQQYFDTVVSGKPEYIALPEEEKKSAKQQFLGSFEETPQLKAVDTKPSFQSEFLGPITNAASALAFDIPRTTMKMQINRGEPGAKQAYEALYPQQKTVAGKMLRFGLEAPATVLGGAGKVAANVFSKTAGLAAKGLAGKMAQGALAGAAFGATTAKPTVEEYKENVGSNIIAGAALPVVASGISSTLKNIAKANPSGRMSEMTKSLASLDNAYQQGIKYKYENGKKIEISNPIKTLIDRKLVPIVENAKANTEHIIENLDNEIDGLAKAYRGSTKLEETIPLNTYRDRVVSSIKRSKELQSSGMVSSTIDKANKIFDDFSQSFGDEIPLSKIDDIRMTMNKRFDPDLRDANRAIGDASRKILYESIPEARETLAKEGELLAARRFAEVMNNKVVKGGRLGNYFAQVLGAIIGSKVDTGIPFVGPTIGALGGNLVRKGLQKSYFSGNPLSSAASKSLKFADILKEALLGKSIKGGSGITPEIVDSAPPLVKPQGNIAFNPLNPITRTDRMLPSPKTAGSSSGPVIYGKDWGVPNEDPYGFLDEAKKAYFGKKSIDIENATPIAYGENGPTLSIKDTVKMIKQDALSGGKKDLALKADELLRRLEAKEKSNQIVSEFNPLKSQAKGSEVGDSLNKSKLILPAALGGALLMQKESEASKPISEGQELRGKASTYGWGEKLNPYTFSGERFNTNAKTVAMRGVPMGTKVEITDNKTGNKVIATVNDGGPGKRLNRLIDLSKGAWKELGYGKPGLLDVSVKIVSVGKGRAYNGKY